MVNFMIIRAVFVWAFLLVLCPVGLVLAQVSPAELRKAEGYMKTEEYERALPVYQRVLVLNPEEPNANFQLGICLLGTGRGADAYKYLIKARDSYTGIDPAINLLIARSQQAAGNLEAAIESYQDYKEFLTSNKKEVESERADIDKAIKQCKTGLALAANPVRARIENLAAPVNSKYEEYTPVITADNATMYFTSRRPNSTGAAVDDRGQYYEDVYVSQNKGGNWTEPENLSAPINSPTHDAAVAISPNGNQLFVYRDHGEGDLYSSTRRGRGWTAPKSLGTAINTKNYREPSVSVTADGKTIYFSSNRPGGQGGLDIYKATRLSNGDYGNVENLDLPVNTPEDEDAPFIHPDGVTLYFSSRGHETMGGFDIFRSQLENGSFSAPENIGYPINTSGDDIYFVLSADGLNGYYASEKKAGLGYKDIYRIAIAKATEDSTTAKVPQGIAQSDSIKSLYKTQGGKVTGVAMGQNEDKFKSSLILVKGLVVDATTRKPVVGKVVVTDNKTGEVISDNENNDVTGEYLVVLPGGRNYGISVSAKDYLFSSENFDLPDTVRYKEYVKNIELKKAVSGATMVLNNIFFDTDKSVLRQESNVELEKLFALLKESPQLRLEIAGHTDNVGAEDHNYRLSEYRAQAVVDYLTKRGIDKTRLEAKGYGKTKPFATNETVEGRQRNRRTELEVK